MKMQNYAYYGLVDTQEYYRLNGDADTLTTKDIDNMVGKDVVFKSPTGWGNVKATRKILSVRLSASGGVAVRVRFGGSVFTVAPWEIISIDGVLNKDYDKDNYSGLLGAYKAKLGI